MYSDDEKWCGGGVPQRVVVTKEMKLNEVLKKAKELKKVLCELLEQTKDENEHFELNIKVWNTEDMNGENSGNKLQLCGTLEQMRRDINEVKREKKQKVLEQECRELEKELEKKRHDLNSNKVDMDMDSD